MDSTAIPSISLYFLLSSVMSIPRNTVRIRSGQAIRFNRQSAPVAVLAILMACSAVLGSRQSLSAAEPKRVRSFKDVERITARHFSELSDYEQGDLITQDSVKKLFAKLTKYGWKVADRRAILGQVLSDDDFLAKQFSTKKGRSFMRKIKRMPNGIYRVDWLRTLPQGKEDVSRLVNNLPDGHKWIEGLTSTKGGQQIVRNLENSRRDRNQSPPRNRIYTERQLVERLKQSYVSRRK